MIVTTTIREAVEKSIADGTETRYSIAKNAELDYSSFARWLDEGRDIRASTIDKLAKYFGLVLVPASELPKNKQAKRK